MSPYAGLSYGTAAIRWTASIPASPERPANLTIENNRLEDVLFGVYLKNAPGSILRNNVVLSKDLEIGRRGDGIKVWYSAGRRSWKAIGSAAVAT